MSIAIFFPMLEINVFEGSVRLFPGFVDGSRPATHYFDSFSNSVFVSSSVKGLIVAVVCRRRFDYLLARFG
jgi:hypothetical protein